jgi:hypothetical protein
MSDVTVISRTQRIVVAPASSSVAVISTGPTGPTGPPGPEHPSGVAEVSGVIASGPTPTAIPTGGLGANILVSNVMLLRGTDVAVQDAYTLRITVEGLYHMSGYVRIDGTAPPPGSLLGIRVNGMASSRHTFVPTGYASVYVSSSSWLMPGDLITMFGYSTGAPWVASVVPLSQIDPISPRLEVWRVVGGPKGDPA